MARLYADEDFSIVDRFLIAGRVVWFYFGKLVWPSNLAFSYNNLGAVHKRSCEWERALEHYQAAYYLQATQGEYQDQQDDIVPNRNQFNMFETTPGALRGGDQ